MTDAPMVRSAQARRGSPLLRVAGFIFYLLAVQALMTAGVGLNVYFAGGSSTDLLLPAISALLAGCYVAVGFFLRRQRIWARNFAFAFAAVSLFAYPVGTALGALVILCIDRANRARVFGPPRAVPAPVVPAAVEETVPVRGFEPDLAPEHAG
jgi:hypothetical protein